MRDVKLVMCVDDAACLFSKKKPSLQLVGCRGC
jgi:hypothetical protein